MNRLTTPCPCCGSINLPVVPPPHPGVILPATRPLVRPRFGRRSFLRGALGAAAGVACVGASSRVWADGLPYARNRFTFARVLYNGSWDAGLPNPDNNLSAEFQRLAGDRFTTDIVQVSLGDKELFQYPFLYITGFSGKNMFSSEECEALRRYLVEGGFLFASDCGAGGPDFQDSIRRLIDEEVFAGDPKLTYVEMEDEEHPIFNIAVPFGDWASGLYTPGRYSGWEYDGRLVCFLAGRYDNNCVLAGRAADARTGQHCIWQGVNVLYYSMMY